MIGARGHVLTMMALAIARFLAGAATTEFVPLRGEWTLSPLKVP